jgi:hypothetical protein
MAGLAASRAWLVSRTIAPEVGLVGWLRFLLNGAGGASRMRFCTPFGVSWKQISLSSFGGVERGAGIGLNATSWGKDPKKKHCPPAGVEVSWSHPGRLLTMIALLNAMFPTNTNLWIH